MNTRSTRPRETAAALCRIAVSVLSVDDGQLGTTTKARAQGGDREMMDRSGGGGGGG